MTLMTLAPSFPPLLSGLAAGPADPFAIACDQARRGVEAGLLPWSIGPHRLRAALVLAPETTLERAMAALPACAVGFQNAFGALAPPEIALHLDWAGGLWLNGGRVGALTAAAGTTDPAARPDWLVVGLDLTLSQPPDREPGEAPERTSLTEEGCGGIEAGALLEAWARHTLYWINELDGEGGRARLHREWDGLAWRKGERMAVSAGPERHEGVFLGIDENFGLLLKTVQGTRLVPLSGLLAEA